jgi:hypothetical protein
LPRSPPKPVEAPPRQVAPGELNNGEHRPDRQVLAKARLKHEEREDKQLCQDCDTIADNDVRGGLDISRLGGVAPRQIDAAENDPLLSMTTQAA